MKGYEPTPDFAETETKFSDQAQFRDLPFLLLFILHFAGIGVIIGLGIATGDVPPDDRVFVFTPELAEITAILVGCGFIFSCVYLQLLKFFPKAMIYIGMGFAVLLFAAQAGYCFVRGLYVAGGVLAVFVLIFALYLFMVRDRLPFAIEMIQFSVGLVQAYPGSQVTAYISLVVQILWAALWTFTVFHASTMQSNSAIIMFVFLIFSFYWVMEVIKNVVHVTVSGIVASWYFLNGSPAMPDSPTFGAAKRALTTSFGSICFGSLIVAIIKTLRAIIRSVARRNGILSFIALCFLNCLDSLVRYFNHYAFCQVAIYGKIFCQAATDTWDLFQRSGIAAIANDNIIGSVLVMGSFFGGLFVGAVGALITVIYPDLGLDLYAMFIIGFLIGFITTTLPMQVVDSTVSCTFVCFAENPEVLRGHSPALFSRFMEADQNTQLVN